MDLYHTLGILRRRWPLLVAVPLLVALLSAGVALARPPSYNLVARLLATRGPTPAESTAGLTSAKEDTVAQDLPAIISSPGFAQDVADALATEGRPVDPAAVRAGLSASNQERVVQLGVTAATPEDAVAIANAAVALLQRNGLRYWGDTSVTPEMPGLNIGVLELPATAARQNGLRAIALEVGLRTLAGLLAAAGLALVLERRTPHAADGPDEIDTAEAHRGERPIS